MTNREDLFYEEIERKLEEMKQQPPKEEKESMSAKFSKAFTIALGLLIIFGLVITVLGLLR